MAKRNPQPASPLSASQIDVGPRWQQAFDAFMESGRLDRDFRSALDDDAALKHAVDEAFRQQVAALGRIGSAFRAQRAVARDAARETTHAGTAEAVAIPVETSRALPAAVPIAAGVVASMAASPLIGEDTARALSESLLGLTSAPSETRPTILDDARAMLVGAQRDPSRAPAAEEALRGLSALAEGVTASG